VKEPLQPRIDTWISSKGSCIVASGILGFLHFNRNLSPEIPPELLYCKPIKANSANELTKAVIKFIRLSGNQAERISVTGRTINKRTTYIDVLGHRKQIGSVKYIPSAMTKGSADISSTIHGKSIKIEIKWGHGHQSPAQAKYQSEIEKAGGVYLIVHSFDQWWLI